ncbi:MAG: hypothetical protein IPK80_10185 [Nannocystis sp.]|nr:hypothetical protein [Nannocystis sp.]
MSARRTRVRGVLLLALVSAPWVAQDAHASPWVVHLRSAVPTDEAMSEAQREYQLGTHAYALGNYDQAVLHFERSYELSDRPELLFNIGQSYAQWYTLSGDPAQLRKARKLFQNYIKFLDASEGDDAEARADAERRIAEIDAELAALAPTPQPQVTPPPVDAPPPAEATKRPLHRRGWFWGVVVGGAIVIAAGITAGVLLSRDPPFEPELGILGRSGSAGPGAPLLRF